MQLRVTFPQGKRVDAQFGEYTVRTDQPTSLGGEGSAPAPFDLFLASLATCAGIYVLGFCQARGIPTSNIELIEHVSTDPETKLPRKIDLELRLPSDFPEKYRVAVARVAEQCKVKKVLQAPPEIYVSVVG